VILAWTPHEVAQTLLDAVALGSVYALIAVGIGLVFGVLRVINFAYGQLIMAGAYALALTSGYSPAASILICFGVVVALAIAMEVAVFRPLRNAAAARMLIATFAISFLLQNLALVLPGRWGFGAIGKVAVVLPQLGHPVAIGSANVRWITFVAIIVAAVTLGALALLFGRTSIGLQMRAAAADFRTARVLGVRANAVIGLAVVISGLLAATVAVILPIAQVPLVTPDYGLRETIIVLVGVVVGGIDRLWSATLGGFVIGFATGCFGGFLPTTGDWPFTSGVYLDSAVYAIVILVLLVRPSGLFAPSRRSAVGRV
jgi:branched-chain amino acid transport system permease protein